MRTPNPFRSVTFLAALAVAAAASWIFVRGEPDGPPLDAVSAGGDARSVSAAASECPEGGAEDCADPAAAPTGPATGGDAWVRASEACVDAGYLCAPLQDADTSLILHFPPRTGPLRVRIPLPSGEEAAAARRLQRAAARGIQAWHGHPFQLRIVERERAEPSDITVRWTRRVEGGALGRTALRYRSGPRGGDFRVVALMLATRVPDRPSRLPDTRALELTAAHEMGHALGLPHSDDPRDLMYPMNTATHPTARDYRTLQALYRIPSGTGIVRR